jgi:hypothetical protein
MEERNFMIFNVSEINSVNFTEVLETSGDTLRISTNGEKTFVKWDGQDIPTSVQDLLTKEGPYTYEQILTILETSEWRSEEM